MTDREWLQSLKKGDEVLIPVRFSRGEYTSHTVDRTTTTQILIGSLRFRKSDGRLVGAGSWASTYIRKPTDETRAAAVLTTLRKKAVALRDQLSVPTTKEELEKFIAAMEPLVKQP